MQKTNLEFARITVVSPIIIHEINELQSVPHPTFEIVRVVSGSDFDSSSPEFHIDSYWIGDDRDSTLVEWVDDEFAVKMLLDQM